MPALSRTSAVPHFWLRAGGLVLARPALWASALRQAGRLSRRGWWRRPPFLPLPDRGYLRFRFETAYGGGVARPEDLIAYLRWCRGLPR